MDAAAGPPQRSAAGAKTHHPGTPRIDLQVVLAYPSAPCLGATTRRRSDHSSVRVVERHVPVRITLQPTRRDGPRLLEELAGQLDDGRLYDRDLPGLARALEPVLHAY
jgi:hypothetical protein